jgi:hypothetical protein
MNIYLLNIPFAIVGVAIAIVPLVIGMKHQSRSQTQSAVVTHADVFPPLEVETKLELAA